MEGMDLILHQAKTELGSDTLVGDVKYLKSKYGVIEFEIVPPGTYSSLFCNKMLNMEIKDSIGYTLLDLNIPDSKAYELYRSIDSIYQDMYDSATTASILRTMELPPEQFCRYSLVLTREEGGIISLSVLSTNMINGSTNTIYSEMYTNTQEFQEFMVWMYNNFESCALKYGLSGNYYYSHIREFID